MFEKLSRAVEKTEERDECLKTSIDHLQSLEIEFQRYFSELKEEKDAIERNPFSISLVIANIVDELQDQFCDLRDVSSARDVFHEISKTSFSFAASCLRKSPALSSIPLQRFKLAPII